MALLDLLGRRWTLRVVWELRDGRARTFRALQASLDDVSPTILNTRLKELREARLVELREEGYALTVLGTELLKLLLPVARLAEDWAEHQRRR
jgi:DNA-binding HxlR family transcriptional regulator